MRFLYKALLLPSLILYCSTVRASIDTHTADGRSLVFEAMKGHSVIGYHTIRFTQKGETLAVDVSINLKSKIFIVPFTYAHTNHEVWQHDKLVSLESSTTTNGRVNTLSAKTTGGDVSVSSDGTTSHIQGPIMTTSYWLHDMVKQKHLLNSQTGALIATKLIADNAVLAPTLQGSAIPAREYQITGNRRFNANVLYDTAGCMVGMNFKVPFDGSRITYRLVARPDATMAPDLAANPLLINCLVNRRTAMQSDYKSK